MWNDLLFSEKMPYQLGRNFIMGGILISSVSYIATFLSPMMAALWWACPFTILPTLYFMKKNNVSTEKLSFFFKKKYGGVDHFNRNTLVDAPLLF